MQGTLVPSAARHVYRKIVLVLEVFIAFPV